MALIQSTTPSSGGGGGGLVISGFALDQLTRTTAYASGALTLVLTQSPLSINSIVLDRNGVVLLYGTDWTYLAGIITILVDNPYLIVSDPPDIFSAHYTY